MKHIQSFHGSVTAYLTSEGYDSVAVLSACNAWRGSQKANAEDTTVRSEVKLGGRVLKDGEDKRHLTVTDSIKEKSKVEYAAAGALISLSDELRKVTEKHGARLVLTELPSEIEVWLDRDTFRAKSIPAKVELTPGVTNPVTPLNLVTV